MTKRTLLAIIAVAVAVGCSPRSPRPEPESLSAQPSILLVTLDTTRADVMWEESDVTPSFSALAGRGVRFLQAYATAPMTLPSHASMLTGLTPAEHGVHENSRRLGDEHEVVTTGLRRAGYRTAAFVSGYPLGREFGLARGFQHFDDDFAVRSSAGADGTSVDAAVERSAAATTDRVLDHLDRSVDGPLFLWVHYFDPHDPYEPPEPYRSRYPDDPYLGEIAAMDRALGRLVSAFESRFMESEWKILVVGDHGEGLGDHGETFHGHLLYQGVMRVPLVIAGSGIENREVTEPVSVRQVSDTILEWAGLEGAESLLAERGDVVVGEAMKPFLQYGWRPQVMAVRGRLKAIRSGPGPEGLEVYDVIADPAETRDLAGTVELDRDLQRAIRDYPLPDGHDAGSGDTDLDAEERRRLASLGYAGWDGRQEVRPDAPRPREMTHLFAALDRGSALFVQERYAEAIPVFERVLEEDPRNLMVAIRLAVAHSVLGHGREAMRYFERAEAIDPGSIDLRHYLAMHHLRSGEWEAAAPLLESVLAEMPDRLPAIEALARIRERQGRLEEAVALLERAVSLDGDDADALEWLGQLAMAAAETPTAIRAFERLRELRGGDFSRYLELGVLYLAAGRLAEARDALERVPPSDPDYPMALFKRAQVSVLLGEPEAEERIRRAWAAADETTRPLIRRERLFAGVTPGLAER